MKQVRRLLLRVGVLALLLLSLSANVARADDGWLTQGLGDSTVDAPQDLLIPEDPGFPE